MRPPSLHSRAGGAIGLDWSSLPRPHPRNDDRPRDKLSIAHSRLEAICTSLSPSLRSTSRSPTVDVGPTTSSMTPTAKQLPAWVDQLRNLLNKNMKENKDLISYALATQGPERQPRVSDGSTVTTTLLA